MAIVEHTVDNRISIRQALKGVGTKLLAAFVFLAGRLGFAAATLLIIIFLSFFGLDMARGAGFWPAVGHGASSTISYLGRLARGDLGTAFAAGFGTRRIEIAQIVSATVPRSLGLLAVSLGGAAAIGLLLGTLAARRRNSLRALPIVLLSLIGISLPSFLAALLLQIAAVSWTRRFGSALLPVGGFGWDAHLVLPALVLAARPIAQITRITSVSLTQVLREDYVRTAHSKGLRNYLVWLRHVWPNVAIPVLTTVGTSVRFSLSSLPVVELYFGWPGIGLTLIRAIARRDDLLTVALALMLGLIFIIINILLEASYRLLDPRLREGAAHITTRAPGGWRGLRDTFRATLDGMRTIPFLRRWLNPKTQADRAYEESLKNSLKIHTSQQQRAELSANIRRERAKTWLRGTLGNLPFVFGALLLAGLLIIYVAGPALSPNNPYTTKGLDKIDGVIQVPPFAPSAEYPWGSDALGRDIQSLVLSGAQQTLTLVGLVMLARLAVGFVLGALAGWQQDKWLDKLIMSTSEVFSALPTLIFAMILILALGIRRGIWVFVVALCFVGWGEMMQFIRSEVIVLRHKLYVESAVASGARLTGIIVRHMLPNLLPALIALAAVEMGAIAMLLGELGFIGIFIGGGAFAEVVIGGPPYHYSDIPEWGALLSNVRTYARGYPWTAIYPALAFFVSILAFNLFGEGLRRLVQDIGLNFNRLVNRYTVIAALVLIWGLGWAQNNTGSIAFYKQQARAFDGTQAMIHLQRLTDPALAGRAIGPHADATAEYIAKKFKEYGLQPGGKKSTYFFDVKRDFFQLTQTPQLSFNGQPLVYRRDFAEIPTNLFNASQPKSGELVVLGYGEQVFAGTSFTGQQFPRQIVKLNLSQNAVLLLNDQAFLPNTVRQGTFYLTDNQDKITQRDSLSAYSPNAPAYDPLAGAPFFFVNKEAVNKMLAPAGLTVGELQARQSQLGPDDVEVWHTGVTIDSALVGDVQHKVPARHVIGYWPGVDDNLDDKLIVVLAQYDGLGRDENGTLYPGVNDNASSVAVMLELLRSWHETGYQPKKTIIFVAYVGEGFDYGQFPNRKPDVERFISGKFGFATAFTPEAFVFLRGLGAGAGSDLTLAAGGNLRLARLFENAARQMHVKTHRANEDFALDVIFGGATNIATSDAPTIALNWTGFDETAGTPADTIATIDPAKLEKSGRTLSLALLKMGREVNY